MSTPTLYTIPMQAKGKYIRAVAALTGVAYQLPAAYEHYKSNKESEFLAKFPFGKIPAWEDGDFRLFEADAIARYLASKSPSTGLLGSSPEDAALIDQWTHLVESEIDVPTSLVRTLCAGTIPYSKPAHTYATDRILRALKVLDTHLATHTFLVGERLTLADLIVAGLIQHSTKFTIDAAVRKAYPHTIRHLETVVNQPQLAGIYGPLEYVEKGIQFVPAKKDDKKKEAKPEKKKEDKPKAKPKVVEKDDDEEDEPLVPEEPKKKNPLDDLPKSTFNLEDWKRAYSNMETRGSGGALEWFYKNYDPTGFSVWRVDFKYPTELTQIFMSSNQIGGFFNRLEASRKYLFASVGVLGEANNSAISGALILRGQEALPVVDVAPDWESYEYVKLDLEKEGDKAFFEAAMAWDLEVDGKKWADGKNFK